MVFLRDPAAIALISDAGECIDQGSRFIRIQMPTASQTMVNNMTRTPTTTATRWRAVLVGGRTVTPPRAIPMATRSRLNRGVWKGNTLPNMMPLHSSRNAATPVTTRCHKAAFSRAGRIFFAIKASTMPSHCSLPMALLVLLTAPTRALLIPTYLAVLPVYGPLFFTIRASTCGGVISVPIGSSH